MAIEKKEYLTQKPSSALNLFSLKLMIALFVVSSFSNISATEKQTDQNDVAQAITVRGDVKVSLPNGEKIKLEQGQWIPEGASLKTAQRSFAKLLFNDRSQMNLAPNSEMIIETMSETEPGMVNLMRGRVRSQVTRNYLEDESESEDSKLFIRTKNAAMGVRGTDFMVQHNPGQNSTNLLTFQGSVAMVSMDGQDSRPDPRSLDAQLNSQRAVRVRQGQASTVRHGSQAAPPRQVNQDQIEKINSDPSMQMEEVDESSASQDQTDHNEQIQAEADQTDQESPDTEEEIIAEGMEKQGSEDGQESEKKQSSRIPPGMDQEVFTSESSELAEFDDDTLREPASETVIQEETTSSVRESFTQDSSNTTEALEAEYDDLISEVQREQEDYIRDQTEEVTQDVQTNIRFILNRE